MNRTIIFSLFFILLSAWPGWGATYYVKAGGNDSLSGLSDATAWATIAKVKATVTSGDTVYFRSQDTWSSSSLPVLAASAGVTYDGSTYGSGTRATLKATGGYATNSIDGVVNIFASNVTFKGFEVDGNTQITGGIYIGTHALASISNIKVDNCIVHDNGVSDTPTIYFVYGIHISPVSGNKTVSNVTLTNTTVYNASHEGIAVYAGWGQRGNKSDTVLIRNCTVYNTGYNNPLGRGHGIALVNDVDNVTVEFCNIYDNNGYGIVVRTSPDPGVAVGAPNNMIIRYNAIHTNAISGILILDNYSQIITGDFYGNLIYNNGNSVLSTTCYDIDISSSNYASSILNFYNNTIYNTVNACTTRAGVSVATYGANIFGTPVFNFKNNIVYTNNYTAVYDRHKWLSHSNNLIYRSDSANNAAIISPVYNSTPISSVRVTVSVVGSYMYFTKNDDATDWGKSFSVGNFVKWSGFGSLSLNNSLLYIYEVTKNYIKVYYDAYGSGPYSDINTVTGEKWVVNTYTRGTTTTWEPSAKNMDPTFTGGTVPTAFTGTYGSNMAPNTNYFAITSGDALDNGVTLGSPYNGGINGAGLATPITRPQGAAYDIGAYEYTTRTRPDAPIGLKVVTSATE